MDERTSKRADPEPSVFSGIVDAAKGKREEAPWTEWRWEYAQEQLARDGEDEQEMPKEAVEEEEEKTLHNRRKAHRVTEEHTGVYTRSKRREGSLVPASSQTNGPLPDARVCLAVFAPLVQLYIYGLIPLPVVTGSKAVRTAFACMQMRTSASRGHWLSRPCRDVHLFRALFPNGTQCASFWGRVSASRGLQVLCGGGNLGIIGNAVHWLYDDSCCAPGQSEIHIAQHSPRSDYFAMQIEIRVLTVTRRLIENQKMNVNLLMGGCGMRFDEAEGHCRLYYNRWLEAVEDVWDLGTIKQQIIWKAKLRLFSFL